MVFLVLGIILVVAAVVAIGVVSRSDPDRARRWSRMLLGVGACAVGGLMTLRGLAVLGAPMVGVGLLLLGINARQSRAGSGSTHDQSMPTRSDTMGRSESLETLGLDEGATDEDVRAAHKRLMKKVHPDTGGSDALARRIQQARDVLLNRR